MQVTCTKRREKADVCQQLNNSQSQSGGDEDSYLFTEMSIDSRSKGFAD